MGLDEIDISSLFLNKTSDIYNLSLLIENATTDSPNTGIVLECLNGTEIYCNTSNATLQGADWKRPGKLALDILLFIFLLVIMLTVGCEITWNTIFAHIKRPAGLFIGMFSQFGIMPLSAFCILLISGTKGLNATGVIIISCCPGGTLSNTFTYFCDGDLSLSIAMTTICTIAAMGMMPLNLWIYGQHFESEVLVIPYAKMALSLVTVTSPTVVGMFLRWKLPRVASVTTKIGGYITILLMIVCTVMEIFLFPNMFIGVPVEIYIIILTLPVIGVTLGYGLAYVLKRSKPVRLTIGIECGVQNVPVALTIIALSFPLEIQHKIVYIPMLYVFAMTVSCTIICITFQIYKKFFRKTADDEMKKEPLLEPALNIEIVGQTTKAKSDIENGKGIRGKESSI